MRTEGRAVELEGVRIDCPAAGRVRLSAQVRYDDAKLPAETYWFDVPERYAGGLSATGNAWLVCLAPLAATLGGPLRISLPVDRLLARNVGELLSIWTGWYPELRTVPLELEVSDRELEGTLGRTGAFFSGGIDSFYTVLRNR